MTTKYDTDNTRDETEFENGRYAAFSDGTGGLVIYDTQNHAGWLHSDATVELAEMV